MQLPPQLQHAVLAPLSSTPLPFENKPTEPPSPVVPGPPGTMARPPAAPTSVSPQQTISLQQQQQEEQQQQQQQQPSPVVEEEQSKDYNAYASPYQLLKTPISSYTHASRQHHLLVPSITPVGIDPQACLSARDQKIQTALQDRLNTLEKASQTLQQQIIVTDASSAKTCLRQLIELKKLRLAEKQKQLREDFVGAMARSTTLGDKMTYRKLKKMSLREAHMLEKAEQKQRVDLEHRKKKKHLEHLQAICDHGRDLVAGCAQILAKKNKLGRAVLQYHQHVEKEEQKKAERISRERMRALREDDEEAYMKLIDEAKDTRLTQLLKQTDSFLNSLTQAVVDQQQLNSQGNFHASDMDDQDGKIDYYKVTHRVKESVSQPSILVGGTLKDYQIKGLQWMVSLYNNHLNGILADEMGLGKTIQTISLITYLIERKYQNGPYLIIVPLSTLTNWTLEFDKWAPTISKIVYKGPPNTRRNMQMDIRRGEFQVLLTTFEYIIRDRPVLSKVKWLHMIIDEGHRMKNTNSKLVLILRQYYHTRYRLILTGTPLQNNLPELWALLNFILPKIFKSVKTFEEWFNTPFSNQGVQDKIDLNEEEQLLIIKRLHKVLRPFLLRRLKKDVESELPDKVERVIKCKLSALQQKIYHQIKKNGRVYSSVEKGKLTMKGVNNTIMQLRKICNHPYIFEEVENSINPKHISDDLLFRVSGKFELLDRTLPKLRATGHRVLIFFQMTQIMTIMEDFLNYRNFPYLRLDGSTKSDDRSQLLQIFNAPDSPYFVFLLSTRAGGLGLNLQTADTVIIFDSDWNPHQDLQAQDRAHRIGQTKEVRIFRLISANSIEENILARANYKLDIDGKVIQAGKFDNRSTDEDREAFLRSLLEDKTDEPADVEGEEEMDDEELNEMLKRSDEELEIFNRIDADRARQEAEYYRRRRGKPPERLIQEDELPEFYRQEEALVDEVENLLEYGRGQRVRDQVRYDDGLTEEQWVEALEDENVDLENFIAQKDARRRKRKEKQTAETEAPKKRGRPNKKETDRKRGRGKKSQNEPDLLPPPIRAQMTRILEECYKAVEEATDENEHTYRSRSALFMDLVDKRDYPIYYTMIKQPIALKMIKKRIHSSYYKTVSQCVADFHLMFDNARTFNEEGSLVYQDADELQRIFDSKIAQLCPGGVLPPLAMNYTPGAYAPVPPPTAPPAPPVVQRQKLAVDVAPPTEEEEEEEDDAGNDDDDDEYEEEDY
ncbi:SNF2 family N-terminal domain-domain-containing protein [Syncephalastrum racemosum]|uniref:SNF2 family N-terminal domain-domain-containing protein n=1 Tax=Syncephalastrum racemosum TaxID=13706 RepID=A0A1X2HMR0_SYNRA|nr:SNF2 family N-terminal domain-domain-containing protein [Syncephalastrum racemosum]